MLARACRRRRADRAPTPRGCATLGARDVVVTGNLKFDVAFRDAARALGAELRAALRRGPAGAGVAASTREGEEALLLDALARSAAAAGDALLVIVPRHPQRFDAVADLLDARGVPFVRRSDERAGAGRRARRARRFDGRAVRLLRARPTSRSSAAACCRSAART